MTGVVDDDWGGCLTGVVVWLVWLAVLASDWGGLPGWCGWLYWLVWLAVLAGDWGGCLAGVVA